MRSTVWKIRYNTNVMNQKSLLWWNKPSINNQYERKFPGNVQSHMTLMINVTPAVFQAMCPIPWAPWDSAHPSAAAAALRTVTKPFFMMLLFNLYHFFWHLESVAFKPSSFSLFNYSAALWLPDPTTMVGSGRLVSNLLLLLNICTFVILTYLDVALLFYVLFIW